MHTLASIESFIGSVWFGVGTFFAGYVLAHVLPVSSIAGLIKKK